MTKSEFFGSEVELESLGYNQFFFSESNLEQGKLSFEDKVVLRQFLSGGLDGLLMPVFGSGEQEF